MPSEQGQGNPDAVNANKALPGWIVGNASKNRKWRTMDPILGWVWTEDRDKAVRYARREDAETVHAEDDDAWRVEPYAPTPDKALMPEAAVGEKAIRHDERKRIIAQGCIHTRKAHESADYDRPDVSAWQHDQNEYFDPTICEIVSEYAAWRDKQATPTPVEEPEKGATGAKLTAEYLAMTPLQKWHTLALHGSLGTDEPWIADMRQTLREVAATNAGQVGAVNLDYPAGAIENGREHLRRLADYDFNCDGGPLRNCADYVEAVRCFEWLAMSCAQLAGHTENKGGRS